MTNKIVNTIVVPGKKANVVVDYLDNGNVVGVTYKAENFKADLTDASTNKVARVQTAKIIMESLKSEKNLVVGERRSAQQEEVLKTAASQYGLSA